MRGQEGGDSHEAEITVKGRIRGFALPGIRERALQADWGGARGGQMDGRMSAKQGRRVFQKVGVVTWSCEQKCWNEGGEEKYDVPLVWLQGNFGGLCERSWSGGGMVQKQVGDHWREKGSEEKRRGRS